MVHFTTILSALVAFDFSFHLRPANAAPLKLSKALAPSDITPALVAAALDAGMLSDVVKFAPEPSAAVVFHPMNPDVVKFAPEASAAAAVSQPESTVTLWETTTVISQATPTAVPDHDVGSLPQDWVLPEAFTDLSPFGIERIAYGSPNIAVVTGIPARASASIPSPGSPTPVATPSAFMVSESVLSTAELPRRWTNSSAAYRLFFPSGSINPGNKPQGGSDFYASPLALQSATNVSLQYSVFFPADFEWVQGGKLPGLYGGHGGCSGGNNAKSCFSTRMMWRQGGVGELYLYAPKDKQTPELCQAPPQSVCDATYGLSIGRGSFHFPAGDWTHVSQTVRLNTPGKQNGGFELAVNGQRIMRRDDVFYRDVHTSSNGDDGGSGDNSGGGGNSNGGWGEDGGDGGDGDDSGSGSGIGDGDGDGGLLGDLLGKRNEEVDSNLSPVLLSGHPSVVESRHGWASQAPLFAPEDVPDALVETVPIQQTIQESHLSAPIGIKTQTLTTTVTSTHPAQTEASAALSSSSQVQMASQGDTPDAVGFSGIFFSTFFGGHEQSWASPKDQFIYFKDFGMTVNA